MGNPLGWCVEQSWFAANPTQCCADPSSSDLSCFVPSLQSQSHVQGHCLSPLSLYNRTSVPPRCNPSSSSKDCPAEQTCILPSPEAQLLRIKFVDMTRGREEIVIWKGPKAEVWRQLRVGTLLPRASWISLTLPDTVQLFTDYVLTVCLALYIFNLLPLPFLDGGRVLQATLDLAFGIPESGDVYSIKPRTSSFIARRRMQLETGIYFFTGIVTIVVSSTILMKELMHL